MKERRFINELKFLFDISPPPFFAKIFDASCHPLLVDLYSGVNKAIVS